ncbi:MAG: replicative DNA helicase [Gammaproteobacteria bacterium]|nr:replicative DNA helicase [Gammaproteobacteria bacterium]
MAVLGGLLLNAEAWESVSELLVEGDFYHRNHQLLYRAMFSLRANDQPIDVVTVAEWIEGAGEENDVGGLQYIANLADSTPSAANVLAYAKIVRERSVLRQLIHVGQEIAELGYYPEGQEARELLDKAESKVFAIAEQTEKSAQGLASINDVLADTMTKLKELIATGGKMTGHPTGFTQLDDLLGGLHPSDLIIVAGRPAMGKTTISMNMAESVAIETGKPVAIFSMEMPAEQLAMRLIASLGRITLTNIRNGDLTDAEWPRVTSAIQMLNQRSKIFIDDSAGLTPNEVRARCRRLAREHGNMGLIVIDYLQLMRAPGAENRVNEISEISRSLKALAKELDCPVIALSQLNRSLENRPDKRPVMSDLRESGSIEQDADIIAFVYRDEVYNEDSPRKGIAELIIRKHRNGPTGTVELTFLGQFSKFENYTPEYSGVPFE